MYAAEIAKLRRIVSIAEKLIATSARPKRGRPSTKARDGKRIRRSGRQLQDFRRMLKAERKRGVSVAELASKHRVTPSYIYQL